jgi:hypothetical protein
MTSQHHSLKQLEEGSNLALLDSLLGWNGLWARMRRR